MSLYDKYKEFRKEREEHNALKLEKQAKYSRDLRAKIERQNKAREEIKKLKLAKAKQRDLKFSPLKKTVKTVGKALKESRKRGKKKNIFDPKRKTIFD